MKELREALRESCRDPGRWETLASWLVAAVVAGLITGSVKVGVFSAVAGGAAGIVARTFAEYRAWKRCRPTSFAVLATAYDGTLKQRGETPQASLSEDASRVLPPAKKPGGG